jgi:hypothetical protein
METTKSTEDLALTGTKFQFVHQGLNASMAAYAFECLTYHSCWLENNNRRDVKFAFVVDRVSSAKSPTWHYNIEVNVFIRPSLLELYSLPQHEHPLLQNTWVSWTLRIPPQFNVALPSEPGILMIQDSSDEQRIHCIGPKFAITNALHNLSLDRFCETKVESTETLPLIKPGRKGSSFLRVLVDPSKVQSENKAKDQINGQLFIETLTLIPVFEKPSSRPLLLSKQTDNKDCDLDKTLVVHGLNFSPIGNMFLGSNKDKFLGVLKTFRDQGKLSIYASAMRTNPMARVLCSFKVFRELKQAIYTTFGHLQSVFLSFKHFDQPPVLYMIRAQVGRALAGFEMMKPSKRIYFLVQKDMLTSSILMVLACEDTAFLFKAVLTVRSLFVGAFDFALGRTKGSVIQDLWTAEPILTTAPEGLINTTKRQPQEKQPSFVVDHDSPTLWPLNDDTKPSKGICCCLARAEYGFIWFQMRVRLQQLLSSPVFQGFKLRKSNSYAFGWQIELDGLESRHLTTEVLNQKMSIVTSCIKNMLQLMTHRKTCVLLVPYGVLEMMRDVVRLVYANHRRMGDTHVTCWFEYRNEQELLMQKAGEKHLSEFHITILGCGTLAAVYDVIDELLFHFNQFVTFDLFMTAYDNHRFMEGVKQRFMDNSKGRILAPFRVDPHLTEDPTIVQVSCFSRYDTCMDILENELLSKLPVTVQSMSDLQFMFALSPSLFH